MQTTYKKRKVHSQLRSNQCLARGSHLPMAIGAARCRSHRVDNSIISKGNSWADKVARIAALRSLGPSHATRQACFTVHIFIIIPKYETIPSYLHQIFRPNSLDFPHFIQSYLQPTTADLSCLNTITASWKFSRFLIPSPDIRVPLSYSSSQGIPPWIGLAAWLHPHAHS